MASASSQDRLRRLLEPVVSDAGLDLEGVQLAPAGRRRLVRVVVDKDGGVDLDAVAAVSQALSSALDASDALGDTPYLLEVSSPGVSRPLTEARHWRRATGRLVTAEFADGSDVTGRLQRADDDGVVLEVAGAERTYPWAALTRGTVQVEFNRVPEPAEEVEPWTST